MSASTSNGRESADMLVSLRELLSTATSHLRRQPPQAVASLEEALVQLETVDENFHSYELVRVLQSRIEESVGPLVDSKVEPRGLEGDGHNVAAQIADEVFSSQEYNQLYQTFTAELKAAVEEMLSDDSLLSSSPSSHRSPPSHTSPHGSCLNDSSSSVLSFNHARGMLFMAPEDLLEIADRLHRSQPQQVRLDAMHHLLQFPSGDLVTSDNWHSVSITIRRTLMDEDEELADRSLKFYYRMFAGRNAMTTREAYFSLVELLEDYFEGEGGRGMSPSDGLNPMDNPGKKLLLRFRLLNHFQMELPAYWLRYSEKYMIVEELITSTLQLLSLTYSCSSLLGPAHFLSLVDTHANWFRKWMHGEFSRTKILKELNFHPEFLQGVVSHVLSMAKGHKVVVKENDPYSEQDLHYVHFIHCLSVLERLLLYKDGRKLFPLHIPGREAKVTLTDLLLHVLGLLYTLTTSPSTPHPSQAPPTPNRPGNPTYDPTLIITHLLRGVAMGNAKCRQMLCQDVVISALLAPLKCAMGTATSPQVGESTLLLLADLVAVLASTESGRHHLINGQQKTKWTSNKTAAVHTIAGFVLHSLSSARPPVSHQVTSAWLFVCRQLYNVGEGLLTLEPYSLHLHIARALQGGEGGGEGRDEGTNGFSWNDALVDNLLNFAATPQGLHYLQQSGQMARCIQYMAHRYQLKLQVSKCEKFGYGCMVTQVATTAAGIHQVLASGFITTLIRDLWTLLDGGEDDLRLTASRTNPLDPMDRNAHKAMISLLNLLSSYPALYEVLSQATPTPGKSATPTSAQEATPTTLLELLERLVLGDSTPKRSCLLNFEEAHHFGLRILTVLVTCLDSFLFLQTSFTLTDTLFSLQREDTLEDSDVIIVDGCSLERNRILVSCYFVGGPNERRLPPVYLASPEDSYSWTMFSNYPPPSEYLGIRPTLLTEGDEERGALYGFLTQSTEKGGASQSVGDPWLTRVGELYCAEVGQRRHLKNNLVALLLEKCVSRLVAARSDAPFPPPPTTRKTKLSQQTLSIDSLGATMAIRYGEFLGLLKPPSSSSSSSSSSSTSCPHLQPFVQLLQKSRYFLDSQRHPKRDSELYTLKGSYTGFDWFLASLYLLMRGSEDRTWSVLHSFSSLLASGYMWLPRLHLSSHLPLDMAYSGILPITAVTAHYVELILQSEVPLVYSAFRMSGYTPSQVVQHWLRQCFWNFLDWPEICLYLATCIVMGIDYQVYYCVSVLKHLEPRVLTHTQEQTLMVFLKEESLTGYHCADWLDFMQQLQSKFRSVVLKAMREPFSVAKD